MVWTTSNHKLCKLALLRPWYSLLLIPCFTSKHIVIHSCSQVYRNNPAIQCDVILENEEESIVDGDVSSEIGSENGDYQPTNLKRILLKKKENVFMYIASSLKCLFCYITTERVLVLPAITRVQHLVEDDSSSRASSGGTSEYLVNYLLE